MRALAIFSALALALPFRVPSAENAPPLQPLQGDTSVHDPSTIHKIGDHYYLAGTGRGIQTMSSPDLIHWTRGEPVFGEAPAWAVESIPRFRGHIWAPDIIRLQDRYLLYYSVSRFGRQTSAIGLATNTTLDPASSIYQWTDHGPVIRSEEGSPYNAIDPGLFQDEDGSLWMTFGSFWKGLYLFELDPKTGKRLDANGPMHRLAWNEEIEAPCLTRRNDHYYLFVNWGKCCRGTNSTYEVRVGRSPKVTGPYLDHEGVDLVDAGGKPFLKTSDRFIGPGHIAILAGEDSDTFSYHYYDRDSRGRSRLAIGRLRWTDDGWPEAVTISD